MRKTLVVTSAGTATTIGLLKGLAISDAIRIITTDINPATHLSAPHLFPADHRVVPLASREQEYLAAMSALAREEAVDAIYPIHDREIAVLARASGTLPGVRLPSTDAKVIDRINDKVAAVAHCVAHGLNTPRTWLGSTVDAEVLTSLHFPLFRKERSGVGSVGARMIACAADLRPEDLSETVVLQTVCKGPEISVDVLHVGKAVIAIARERLETKAGVCTKARVFVDPALTALAQRIVTAFALPGLTCFQIMHDDGGYAITDINPRCGGGTAMTLAVGINLYLPYFLDLLELPGAQAAFSAAAAAAEALRPTIVCRYHEEVVTHVEVAR